MRPAERILGWNALAGRYAFSQMRPRNFGIALGIYGSALVITALGLLLEHASAAEYARKFYGFLAALQLFMLWVLGLYVSSSIMTEEAEDRSLDFFRLLPLSPREKISGLLFGRNLTLLVLALFNAGLLLAAGIAGRVPFPMMLQTLALITAAGAVCMMAGLLSSIGRSRTGSRNSSLALLIGCVFILPYILGLASNWNDLFPEGARATATFYGFPFPLLALVTAVILYFAGWLYAGLARRFRNERQPLFSPAGAIGFMAGFAFVLAGLFRAAVTGHYGQVGSLWFAQVIILLIPLLLLPLAASRRWEDYAESAAVPEPPPRLFSLRANHGPSLVNIALWAGVALLLLPPGRLISPWSVVALASFWLVLVLLVEATVLGEPLTVHVKWLGILAAVLYLAMPPLLGGVTGLEDLGWFGPASYFVLLGENLPYGIPPVAVRGVIPYNLFLAALLCLWIRRRYRCFESGAHGAAVKSR